MQCNLPDWEERDALREPCLDVGAVEESWTQQLLGCPLCFDLSLVEID
jgi:hypothetical protein